MDIGSIFLILAVIVPVVIFIGRPLMERDSKSPSGEEQDISSLLAERDQVVATLQEMDDDFNLGKIPPENYTPERQILLKHGADILRQIDTYQKTSATGVAEDRLEAAVITRRLASEGNQNSVKKNGNAVPPVPDDELEQMIALRRRQRQGKAGGFCPKCGKPVQEIDRFCPRCGANLV